jgi:predicted transcriptional regulator
MAALGGEEAEVTAEDVLGSLEAALMRVLWEHGELSVTDARHHLNPGRERPLAYTTVMTVLARLADKSVASRRPVGRQFIYRAAVDEGSLIDATSAQAVESLVRRYGTSALVHFAHHLERLDPETRAQLLAAANTDSEET